MLLCSVIPSLAQPPPHTINAASRTKPSPRKSSAASRTLDMVEAYKVEVLMPLSVTAPSKFPFTGDTVFWQSVGADSTSFDLKLDTTSGGGKNPYRYTASLQSSQIGEHVLRWATDTLTSGGSGGGGKGGGRKSNTAANATSTDITHIVEVTCSDGIPCNGAERLVSDVCTPAPISLCDDGVACTNDTCTRAGFCGHLISDYTNCPACKSKNCQPKCSGAQCGV